MTEYKYHKLENWIRTEVHSGTYKAGSRIPTETELMNKFGVSRQTVRTAVSHLEEQGFLQRIQGSGTFITIPESNSYESDEKDSVISHNITMVMTEPNSYIFPDILNGATDVLSSEGYQLNIKFTDSNYDKEREILEDLLKRPPEGLIIEPLNYGLLSCNYKLFSTLASQIPCIMIHACQNHTCLNLSIKDRVGGRKITEYLISNGHRKIGMILRTSEMTGQLRFAGYLDALRAHNIPYDADRIIWSMRNQVDDLFEADGCRTLKNMLHKISAVVCHDDRLAFKLITYLQNRGLRVPEDISVAGYDDSFFSTLSYQITTISHPKYKYGQNAAYAILDLIKTGTTDMSAYEEEPRLIIRDTVGKVNS
jgi:GntR family transcriptional regulator of arabinose operon